MDILRAKELLAALADGVNPLTGEILPDDNICNQAEIVRALNTAVIELDKQATRKARPQPDKAGKPWSKEEEAQLVAEYQKGIASNEIAKLHSRSKGAIASRLVRLGLITDRDAAK